MPPCAEMGALGGGPVPSTLSREPVPGKPWDAQWRGAGGEGMRAGSLTGLGIWGQCSQRVDWGVLLEGAGEPGEGGVVLPLAQGFWSC